MHSNILQSRSDVDLCSAMNYLNIAHVICFGVVSAGDHLRIDQKERTDVSRPIC
jgi:hypothetical protein